MAEPTSSDTSAEVQTHPLQNTWSFWEHRKGGGEEYGTNMHKIGDVATVEDFWRFKNNIPNPSQVFTTAQSTKRFQDREVDGFSIFKAGIRPEWEDAANMKGGEIFVRKTFNPRDLDEFWERLCLGMVGETIDPADEICGARVVDKSRGNRTFYRFELWFRSQDESMKELLQRQTMDLCGGLSLPDYRAHSHAMDHHGGGKR